MSQENVEIVRRFLEGAQETPDAVWNIFDEEVEWDTGYWSAPDFPERTYGPDAVREFFRRWVGAFDDWGYVVEELIEGQNSVVAQIHQWGCGKGSGVRVDEHFWQVWTLREGRAVRVRHATERADALEAAGLRESGG